MLDNNGTPCSANEEYSKDKCANEVVEKESLKNFGCTTPFGLAKNKICRNQEIGAKVDEIYTNKIQKHHHMCQSSCSFFAIMGIKGRIIYFFHDNLHQDINRVFTFSRYLNGTFS